MEEAFEELSHFDPEAGASSRRQRVLAKIAVDAFQLRLVDLAAVLAVVDSVLAAPEGRDVVVVLYAGGAHAACVESFWRSRGFTGEGLPRQGLVPRSKALNRISLRSEKTIGRMMSQEDSHFQRISMILINYLRNLHPKKKHLWKK